MNIKRLDLSRPVMAQFEVTDSCNHKCLHCYHLDSDVRNRPNDNKIDDEVILSVAKGIVESNIFNVVVTGGEPLLKKELTKQVIQILRDANIQVGLNTNLVLIDQDMLAFLKEFQVGILTSCPSMSPSKYNYMVGVERFDIFCEKLSEVYASGVGCSVNMVVTKGNVHEIRETAIRLKEKGCYSFSATPMFLNMAYPRKDLLLDIEEVRTVIEDLVWIADNLKIKVDILESLPKCVFPENVLNKGYTFLNRKCQAGRTVVGISPNGDVRPCSTNTIVYGNILKEGIRTIWGRMKIWRTTQYFPKECLQCAWIDRCNAGCRINSKTMHGEWDSPEIWYAHPFNNEPPTDYHTNDITNDTLLYVNHDFKVREEYQGVYVLYVLEDESFLMVNQSLMDFILLLSDMTMISVKDLANQCEVNASEQSFTDILNLLINKNILKL